MIVSIERFICRCMFRALFKFSYEEVCSYVTRSPENYCSLLEIVRRVFPESQYKVWEDRITACIR